jgi:hypothetical protein
MLSGGAPSEGQRKVYGPASSLVHAPAHTLHVDSAGQHVSRADSSVLCAASGRRGAGLLIVSLWTVRHLVAPST